MNVLMPGMIIQNINTYRGLGILYNLYKIFIFFCNYYQGLKLFWKCHKMFSPLDKISQGLGTVQNLYEIFTGIFLKKLLGLRNIYYTPSTNIPRGLEIFYKP